jgi:hypothetical protein
MPRELVWKDQPRLRGWGCSRCSWVFNPPAPPVGENFDAIMLNFQAARDEAFGWHVCDKPHRKSKAKGLDKRKPPGRAN